MGQSILRDREHEEGISISMIVASSLGVILLSSDINDRNFYLSTTKVVVFHQRRNSHPAHTIKTN